MFLAELNHLLILIFIVDCCCALTLGISGGGLISHKISLTPPYLRVPVLSHEPLSKSVFVAVSFLLYVI
jgi:hypothetical protein